MDLEGAFVDVARLVGAGEWTTYGDISGAVCGSARWARAVGRAAATLAEFPNAHRVLRADGSIARRPCSRAGGVRDKLEAEGVSFRAGRADPTQRVHWDELRRRLDALAEAKGKPGAGR